MSGAGIYIKTPSGLVAAATVPGKQGSQGPQSSLTAGPVTTGAAGTNAAATITGAGPVQTLNLTIPRGTPGSPTEFELRGTGSPEGVVTAPVGTYYTDTALTNGAMRWAKKTGTGNTGWVVTEGDTGLRNVTSLTPSPGWTGRVHLRRRGNTVFAVSSASNETLTAVAGAVDQRQILDIPLGFRPYNSYGMAIAAARSASPNFVAANGYGAYSLRIMDVFAGTPSFSFSLSWVAESVWPTTLPGTAA